MKDTFNKLKITNLTTAQLDQLWKMKNKHKHDRYKIIITTDRCDYDNLSELSEHPERGVKVGTFYFNNPDQLDLLLMTFEGHFYQTFELLTGIRKGSGCIDDLVYEDWWNDDCIGVCESCFLRKDNNTTNYKCKKERI